VRDGTAVAFAVMARKDWCLGSQTSIPGRIEVHRGRARRSHHEPEDATMKRNLLNTWRRTAAKTAAVLLAGIAIAATVPATDAAAGGQIGNYLALKGGFYSPSAEFDLGNVNAESALDGSADTGVAGEIAYGHYFSPSFALEFGVGYFRSKGTFASADAGGQELKFDVIPVIASAKVFVPVGSVFPYGEAGLGAYFTQFDVSESLNTFEGSTTLGAHAGAGLNIDVSENVFVGLEMRYVWAEPFFGDQDIDLNGEDYALNGFNLNGFTTMFVLGLGF